MEPRTVPGTIAGRRIAVIGAGAVGSLVGGLLSRAGEDVTLVGRHDHIEAVRSKGLHISGALGELVVRPGAAETLDFRPDVVLLAVKTQDVEAACRPIADLARDAPIVTLQNGVRSDEIVASILQRENIVSGVVMLNAQFLRPGGITYARAGFLTVGAAFGPNGPMTREMAELLGRAVPTRISDNIRGAHWTKLLFNNLANGLEAMTGLGVRECFRHPVLARISALSLKEGYRVIRKAGIRAAPLPGVPLAALSVIALSPLPLAAWIIGRAVGSGNTLSSTLQSIRRGRPTEMDYLNGEIVRLGRELGIDTPCNTGIVEAVKEVEKTGRFRAPAELAGIFFPRRPGGAG